MVNLTTWGVMGVLSITGSAMAIGPVNQPDGRVGGARMVLAELPPADFGRSRVISATHHASPEFVLQGNPINRGGIGNHARYVNPGHAKYGAPAEAANVRTLAKVGETYLWINPWERLNENTADEFHMAREYWLVEHGYVGRARVVNTNVDGLMRSRFANEAGATELPQPRATIQLYPEFQIDNTEPLQVRVDEKDSRPVRISIISHNHEMYDETTLSQR